MPADEDILSLTQEFSENGLNFMFERMVPFANTYKPIIDEIKTGTLSPASREALAEYEHEEGVAGRLLTSIYLAKYAPADSDLRTEGLQNMKRILDETTAVSGDAMRMAMEDVLVYFAFADDKGRWGGYLEELQGWKKEHLEAQKRRLKEIIADHGGGEPPQGPAGSVN